MLVWITTGVYVRRALSEVDERNLEHSDHHLPVSTTNAVTPPVPEHQDTPRTSLRENPFQIPRKDHQEPSFRYGARLLNENQDDIIQQGRSSAFCNLNMQILGGFITALGVAAVAIAFTALNAATFGIGGLVLAGIGIAATLAGMGLFAAGSIKKCDNTPPTIEQPLALL